MTNLEARTAGLNISKSGLVRTCLIVLVACISPASVHAQDCTDMSPDPSKAVRGLLKAEWDKLYKEQKLGCPLSVETPLSERSGAYQDFQRGSIAHSPEPTAPNAIQAAYYSEGSCTNPPALKRNACVVLRWHDMPPGTFFRITLANGEYPGQPESDEHYLQTLVNVAAQQVFSAPVFNPNYTVLSEGVPHDFLYVTVDEPLTSTSGAIGWAINKDIDGGRYRFAVESCVYDQDRNGRCSARSNFVYVDFDMLKLDPNDPLKADESPVSWEANYKERRKEVLRFACRFGNQYSASWRDAIATPKQFNAEFGKTAFAMMELGEDGCPNRNTPHQNKTDLKTSMWWAEDPIMSLHLGCSGMPDNFRSECEVLLALRSLQQLTEPGSDIADTKRDINDAFETGSSIAGAVLGGLGGAISGGAAGLVVGAVGGFFAGKALPPPCRPSEIIKGDYDMSLVWAVRFAYVYGPPGLQLNSNPKMDVRTWEHLRELLSVRGPVNLGEQSKDICGLTSTPETENHILMTESSRYLTNQLLFRDGIRRGELPDYSLVKQDYDLAIIRRLQRVLIEDFYEFNSTPYQRLTVYAIRNLRDFSFSHNVRVAAEAVLYYMDAKYAMSSNGLRRFAPFRRQDARKNYRWLVGGKSDQELPRLALLVGPGTVFEGDFPPDNLKRHAYAPGSRHGLFSPQTTEAMVFHAVGPEYTVHPIIRDYFVLNRPFLDRNGGFLQRFKHAIPEIYFQSSRFLISAGGYEAASRLSWKEKIFGDEDSSPRATTLMISQERVDVLDMIRFEGFFDKKDRNNLCVVDNFACGMNPVIPSSIPDACKSKQGFWTFINFNSSSADCYRPYGVHIAVYARECDRRKECAAGGDRWGLLEAVDAEPVFGNYQSQPRVFQENDAFQRFMQTVLNNNPQALSDGWSQPNYANVYRRIIGQPITFSITSDEGDWQIRSVGNELTQHPKDWALAEGRVMRSLKGQACVEINNFWRNERLVLELRNELAPKICIIRPAELPPSCQNGIPVVC